MQVPYYACSSPRSGALAYQADENILERALTRVQILEPDPEIADPSQQRGDPRAFGVGVENVFEFGSAVLQRETPVGEFGGDRCHRLLQMESELFLAELFHQRGLLLDHDELSFADHPDAVGHLLSLLDVVGGQDDGRAGLA